jgi:hypothetical protein
MYRCSRVINSSITAVGKPLCRQLTEVEKSLFLTSSFTIPTHSYVAIYSQLYLKQCGRIINCRSAKSTLRDNTGLVYSDSNGHKSYGHLLNIILFEQSDYDGEFVTVIPLCQCGVTICTDSTTNAQVDDHIVCLLSPM